MSGPTREELIEAYDALTDDELDEHNHAVQEVKARRRAQLALGPADPIILPAPVDGSNILGPAERACTCGIAKMGGKCDDWCDAVKP